MRRITLLGLILLAGCGGAGASDEGTTDDDGRADKLDDKAPKITGLYRQKEAETGTYKRIWLRAADNKFDGDMPLAGACGSSSCVVPNHEQGDFELKRNWLGHTFLVLNKDTGSHHRFRY